MNDFEQPRAWQTIGDGCVQAVGHVVTFGLAIVLLVLWALSGPLFYVGDGLAEVWKRKKSGVMKGKL
jgi:hypothetical protein